MFAKLLTALTALTLTCASIASASDTAPPGIVSNVKVLTDKVHDVSSMEAWKKSFIKEGMTDAEKALAIWKSIAMFQHQESPPNEFLQASGNPQDPIRVFNVYGYSMCNSASANLEALGRYTGLKARGWGINCHSVAELYYDDAWHLLDGSLITYFPKKDGKLASVEEIMAAVKEWYDKNPGYFRNGDKLVEFHKADGWSGWKKGPELLANCPLLDAHGWYPARTHGWYAPMQEYDGTYGKDGKPFVYEYGYAQGYQVNIQLRAGEKLTRNWFNKGMHINMLHGGGEPGCLKTKSGESNLCYTPKYGDLAPGRIGNGTHEYEVPLAGGVFKSGALVSENLASQGQSPLVKVQDAAKPAVLVIRMQTPYVYLKGELNCKTVVGKDGEIAISFSDNNGNSWKEVAKLTASEEKKIDLGAFVGRRYDYRLKIELKGEGTGLDALKLTHDIQHSQRVLPAFTEGTNTVTFSAGPQEGTISLQGNTDLSQKSKNIVYTDYNPQTKGLTLPHLKIGDSGTGEITFPVETPGEMTRLRFGTHYRARDAKDGWDYQVSFDGTNFKTVDRAEGPFAGMCKYITYSDIPAGTKKAWVRFSGQQRNTTMIFDFRIDADYKEPNGGFAPVKVSYLWEENGQPKQDIRVINKPEETFTIECATKPLMKSIVLELAP